MEEAVAEAAPPAAVEEAEPESWADLAAEVGAEPEPGFADELADGAAEAVRS